jgi:Putative sensor
MATGMATQTPAPPARPTRQRLRVADSAAYVLVGFPLAVVAFVLLVTGFTLGIGLLAITIGLPVLAAALGAARAFARVERTRLDALLGYRTPRPAYRLPRGGALGRVLSAGADHRRWLDLLHGIVAFPVAVAAFSVVVGWFAAAVGGLGYVLWEWSVPHGDDDHSLAYYIGLGDGRTADILLTTALGAVAALTLPWVVRGCAALQAGVSWSLLVDHGED